MAMTKEQFKQKVEEKNDELISLTGDVGDGRTYLDNILQIIESGSPLLEDSLEGEAADYQDKWDEVETYLENLFEKVKNKADESDGQNVT
jgi:hypothetical protein